ncbi:arginine decarboxylase, pyruvoyl-dependent [bacterium]|nr:arginine decarboxylase, pyruvoyl-dependent [bacterium]
MTLEPAKHYFLVSGTGKASTPLNAFDAALLNAGIGNVNLLKMSSIVPPHCQRIEPASIAQGTLVPIAYASMTSSLPGEVISAGVAVGIPEDDDHCGVIMEYSARGHRHEIEEIVSNMAHQALEMRGLTIKSIECCSVEAKVENVAAVFAGVVLI